jgi:hypothetical protein
MRSSFLKSHFSEMKKSRYFTLILITMLLLTSQNIFAEGIRIFESAKSEKETKETLEVVLGKMDPNGYKTPKKTLGFSYLYKNRWLSPFKYAIYIGPIKADKPQTIVRIEGNQGDAYMIDHILSIHGLKKYPDSLENDLKLKNKYHIFAQGINVYAPWAAMVYNGYQSPRMTTKQTFSRFLFYFIMDAVVIYAGGTNWFQEKFNVNTYRGNIAAGLLLVRVIGAIDSANMVRGHNRIAELKYTFPLK